MSGAAAKSELARLAKLTASPADSAMVECHICKRQLPRSKARILCNGVAWCWCKVPPWREPEEESRS